MLLYKGTKCLRGANVPEAMYCTCKFHVRSHRTELKFSLTKCPAKVSVTRTFRLFVQDM